MILRSFTLAALLSLASVAFPQPQSGLTPPSMSPSDTPAVTPSQAPSAMPSQSPSVTPSQTPSAATPSAPRPVGGMSQCQNLIGADRDKCLQDERAATTGGAGAGSGATSGTSGGATSGGSAPR
jgi:hypothetical protein